MDLHPPSNKLSHGQGITIWQWNCRGFKNKYGSLSQYISSSTTIPSIIALQETNTPVRLPGYITYETGTDKSLHTLVSKRYVAIQHPLKQSEEIGILLEIIPHVHKKARSLYVLNVYCRPKSSPLILQQVIEQATLKAANNPFVITGDFNAAHPLWGYAYTNPRGTRLHSLIESQDLTIVTDHSRPTRIGTSVTRDTAPDLTFTKNIPQVQWIHTGEYQGSDHAILSTTVIGSDYKAVIGRARLTDWTKLREERSNRSSAKSLYTTGSNNFIRISLHTPK